MAEPPVTRASLLVRLRDPTDREAWSQFVELYAPLLYGLARKRGLQDADAADVTQEVFRAVAAAEPDLEYDRRRGSFRGWLYTVARNKIHDALARRARQLAGTGDTGTQRLLEEQPARDDEAGQWEHAYRQRVFAWAAEQVRGCFAEATWQAFWQVAVLGKSGEEAAAALGMSVGAVYVAKSRVLARLKKQIEQWRDE
jgi:RNA polymerase sigma-70 factor (ECF subfamily)